MVVAATLGWIGPVPPWAGSDPLPCLQHPSRVQIPGGTHTHTTRHTCPWHSHDPQLCLL